MRRPSPSLPPARHRVAAPIAAAVAVLALLSGCTSESPEAAARRDQVAGGTVLQPGGPGEPNATADAGDVAGAEPDFSESDVAFVQMMIPHHAQAIEMAKLAGEHAVDRRVKVLAERIRAGQGPEIIAMAAWLDERGIQVPSAAEDPLEWDHSDHGHNGMHGMLTDAELAALADARGHAFDRLFLERMVQHHEGAVQMADDAAPESTDIRVGEMISDIAAVQIGEIDRMRDLLTELS